ncbi:DnaA/Hda family protein [Collinsella sp. An2]|uniref:DnaA ATPase domain-containing protein n=1 Tax=Collinsella sp. An2 TaxID=1965585 RepID=UPI000B3AC99A|nr:DnaA/Hda family protein [Collinsella sp. An2]OUP10452.1 chromosomal replication initiator DnaA [Collinsella sp. An2]
MDNEAKIILDDTISFCRRDGRDARLINMLAQSLPLELTDESLTIEAPSRFAYAYLMKQREIIERYLEEIAFCPLSLHVTVPQDPAATSQTPVAPAPSVERSAAPEAHAPAASATMAYPESAPIAEPAVATPVDAMPARPAASTLEAAPSPFTAAADTKVTVTNTLSPEAFRKMVATMKGEEQARRAGTPAPVAPSPEPESAPAHQAHANSKFTFENFVYGDENKHAYQSAVRFAAMAEEPGSCTSLFIYGNSGLGKTHLLLAIKNYLNETKPYIRVKYANSQAYIDDFINEVAIQKTEGRAILRDYHDADVLIIDDIQNIIGKTASIEYFFRLMDEFIRDNKKIVIASDRAPKKLGMDERLTSRFNAGMLCLVSEPGFEMKYTILKRYYEHTILPAAEAERTAGTGDDSLLGTIRSGGGHLTDEQLRHMAEISGTNIRELESFCERCAGDSFEKEQAGQELTGDDIDRIANEYFDTAHKKIHVDTVQAVVEEFYHVSHEDLIGPRRPANIAFARHVAVYLAMDMCEMTTPMVGAEFGGRDHSTVLNSIKVIEKKVKEDRSLVEDLQLLRNKIILRS